MGRALLLAQVQGPRHLLGASTLALDVSPATPTLEQIAATRTRLVRVHLAMIMMVQPLLTFARRDRLRAPVDVQGSTFLPKQQWICAQAAASQEQTTKASALLQTVP